MKKGFTLIELLVVVLIIGILAAIAVPQYQKAVEKSKATQALALLKTLYQAPLNYFLAHGEYPDNFNQLDVEIPWTDNEKWYTKATDTRSNKDWSVQIYKGNGAGILIGRLSGAYKGSGFAIYIADQDKPSGKIICMERKSSGVIFEKEDGSYCAKILNGIAFEGDAQNNYLIP